MHHNNTDLVIFVPSIEDGGVEKNLYLISNFLAKKGIKVNLITANFDKKKKFIKSINFISPKNNFFNKKNRFYKTIYCFYLLLKFFFKKKKILILSFQANIYAIFFAYIFRIDIITRSNTAPLGWSSNKLKRFIFKLFFKFPKKIIVNSFDFKKQLDKEFKINSLCIYNPFDSAIVRNKSKSKVNFSFFNKKTLNFINIGRMTDQKDQILILKAFKNIKHKVQFKLIIMGKGKNKKLLNDYITINDLQKNIKLIDYKQNPYPYIKKSDVFILSSKFEGLPNVLLEAQFLKKTIISTNCPTGPREILLDGKAGFLFKVGNVKQLQDMIVYVNDKKNKKIIKQKINIGFKSMARFNFDQNINKYFKLLKGFL